MHGHLLKEVIHARLRMQDYLIVGRLIRLSSMPQVGPLQPQHIARLFAGRWDICMVLCFSCDTTCICYTLHDIIASSSCALALGA